VPYCVFTDPQLGGIGMTEKEARAKGFKLKIGKCPMTRVARAIERGETAGLMKIVIDASNDRISELLSSHPKAANSCRSSAPSCLRISRTHF